MDIFNPAFWTFMAVIAGIYVILSLGLYVQFSMAGLPNFGHVAFMAVAAYTMAILVVRLKMGLRKDGRITAVECECIQRGGAHSGYGVVTIATGAAIAFLRVGGSWRLIALRASGSWVAAVGIMVLGLQFLTPATN